MTANTSAQSSGGRSEWRVVAFNVKFSENVGDGIIAECMEHAARAQDVELLTLDLAGRTSFGERTVRARALVLRVLAMMPPFLRRRIVRARLSKMLDAVESRWREVLAGADLALIGGGNLLQDDGLNFPLKVGAALDLAARAGVPTVVHSVGAVPGWSDDAKVCLAQLRDPSVRLSTRDETSRRVLEAETGRSDILVTRDPGLLAEALIDGDTKSTRTRSRPTVGIGVIHPAVVAHHGGAIANATASFAKMVHASVEKDWDVILFTNGAKEDEVQLERVRAELAGVKAGRLSVAARPVTPSDLADTINGFDGLIAHRLHACIVAYALDVPSVGLTWDEKVHSFFASVGRAGFVVEADQPEVAVDLLEQAIDKGYDQNLRAAEIAAARANFSAALFSAGSSARG